MNTLESTQSKKEKVDEAIQIMLEIEKEYEALSLKDKERWHLELEKSKEDIIKTLDESQSFSKEQLQRPFELIH